MGLGLVLMSHEARAPVAEPVSEPPGLALMAHEAIASEVEPEPEAPGLALVALEAPAPVVEPEPEAPGLPLMVLEAPVDGRAWIDRPVLQDHAPFTILQLSMVVVECYVAVYTPQYARIQPTEWEMLPTFLEAWERGWDAFSPSAEALLWQDLSLCERLEDVRWKLWDG